MTTDYTSLHKFIKDQLSVWPEVSSSYRSLKKARVRTLEVNGMEVTVQHNPARLFSSTVRTDPEFVLSRKCLLCEENCPKEQIRLRYEGRKGWKYGIQVNPYPIFPDHLVVVSLKHVPQSISHRFSDMLDLARSFDGYVFFYNGPQCGASAPDHMHFQAAPKGIMPLQKDVDALVAELLRKPQTEDGPKRQLPGRLDYVAAVREARLYHYGRFCRGIYVLRAKTAKSLAKLFYRLLDTAPLKEGETEPRINLFTYCEGGEYRAIVVFREKHASSHFSAEGPDHLTMRPGCADMAGCLVAPVKEDFEKLDSRLLAEMLDEVALNEEDDRKIVWKLSRTQPLLRVGIMSAPEIIFEIISDGAGPQKVSFRDGRIDYNGVLYDQLVFDAATMSTLFAEPSFRLRDVIIGKEFHWQRKLDLTYAGSLEFIVEGDCITAVNRIGLEDYLLSVISSEMKASASPELLKAHAVISRSWVLSQLRREKKRVAVSEKHPAPDAESFVSWFDHDDHENFDVCADDHCQRYQGLTFAIGKKVRQAIDETWGEVLLWNGELCDARFSKCCGGVMESFPTCWEDKDYPYLQPLPDTPGHNPDAKAFCDTDDREILSQVLNSYDVETSDFFRWKVRYSQAGLSALVKDRLGVDFGEIEELRPLQRGASGRISLLLIKGSLRSMAIGKELIIRRALSDSHLKSSAFEVTRDGNDFILEGKGWGHGVGLCQIGAAVMATRGYDYREILSHYYPGAELTRE